MTSSSSSTPHPTVDRLAGSAYAEIRDDGIGDILLGLLFLAFGLTASSWFDFAPVIVLLVAAPLWKAMRARWVETRTGYVRLAPDRLRELKRHKRTVGLTAFALAVGLLLLKQRIGETPEAFDPFRPLALFALLGVPLLLGGRLFRANRLFGYAAVLAALAAGAAVDAFPLWVPFYGTGVAMVGVGVGLLVRLVRRYPADPGPEHG